MVNDIGARFREIRELLKFSQRDLGSKLGVGQSFISKIENSKNGVDVITILKLCELADITINEFLKVDKKEALIMSVELKSLLSKASKLKKSQIIKLTDFLESL